MRKISKIIAALFAVIILVALAIFASVFIKGYNLYQDKTAQLPISQKITEIRSKPNYTQVEELTSFYKDAVVSVEDQRFYNHGGYDMWGIVRAVLNNIWALKFVEGGSTITQQLAKNMYFSQEKTVERKVAELFVAIELEKICQKDEILELYVNTIYFGSGYYSIYDASMGYYQKAPSLLSDYESAILAGIPNAPSIYSLDNNPSLARERMDKVLIKMLENNKISQQKYLEVLNSQ